MWIQQQLLPMKKSAIRFIRVPEKEAGRGRGISCAGKYARHMEKQDYTEFDYLIGINSANIRNMTRITGGDPDRKFIK